MTSRVLPNRAVIRSSRFGDKAFLTSLAKEAFGRYARDPERGLLQMMEHGTTLVAEHALAGKPVPLGFVVIEVSGKHASAGALVAPRLAHLSAIAVQAEARGCGIGRDLLAAAEDAAREQGAVAMSLLTAKTNAAAQALFRNAGYSPILPLADVYKDEEDGLRMLKSLTMRG